MIKVNKEPFLGQNWVWRSQILIRWNFRCKFSLSKFRLMLRTGVRGESASNLPRSRFHCWNLDTLFNGGEFDTSVLRCCGLKLGFGLDMFDTWFGTCRIWFEQDWMRGSVVFEICSLCRFCCKIVQQNFAQVQKNACVWLAVESLVQNEFWMFASRSQRSQCRLMY